MKPFNLGQALDGLPVVTRDGRPVTQIKHFAGVSDSVYGVLDGKVCSWDDSGRVIKSATGADLFMAPVIHKGFLNVRRQGHRWLTGGVIHDNLADAQASLYIGEETIPISWEK